MLRTRSLGALFLSFLSFVSFACSSSTVAATVEVPMLHHVEQLPTGQLFYNGHTYTMASNVVSGVLSASILPPQGCEDDTYLVYACNPSKFIGAVCCVVVFVILAGAMSGLTVGVLSLDTMHLSVSPTARNAAARLLPVLSQHRLLLVTLVFMNALANEALPIFLNTLINPVASVVFSVTFVVLFGEIVPTALCTGDRQLVIGAACVPLLRGLIRMTYPISYPISVLLNRTVGETSSNLTYSRDELKALVQLQYERNPRAGLTSDDVDLLQCVLELGKCTVQDCMTPAAPIEDAVASPPSGVPLGSHLLDEGASPVTSDSTLIYAHKTGLYPVLDGVCGDKMPCMQVEPSTPLSSLLALFLRHPYVTTVLVVTTPSQDSDKEANPLDGVVGIVRRAHLSVFQPASSRGDLKLAMDDVDDHLTENSSNESKSPTLVGVHPSLFFSSKDNVMGYSRVSCVDDMEGGSFVPVTAATCS
ncbi:hypothetical protein DYB31_013182 [Aphanomyces astaci]|uniref:CNNM transmembrane domain-containing protein n=1 Tax=Aphanomyces astaci TaxID=112090 RepID=A0A397FAF3_APHAT|nr:hypothetical protein DYB31_013182 [Aphanomyces astaci]